MATQIMEMSARPGLAERLHQATGIAGRIPVSLLALMMRVALAAIFIKSGMTKLVNFDITVSLFQDEYMVPLLPPAVAAVMATVTELGCASLILAGLGTRFAALPLLGLTFVIEVFVYPENWVEHLTWASMLLYLVAMGAGKLSLDGLILKFYGRD